MDANMHRLPDNIYIIMPKFLVPLPSIIWHPSPTDDAVLLVKATERQFPHQEKPVSKNYWHFKEKNKILFLFQYLEIHFPISQSPNHGIIRIFRVIIRIIIFGTRASRSVKGRCITKVCQWHLEFWRKSGNAGTGMCQRGASEHGCECAPVAGKANKQNKILSGTCRRCIASGFNGRADTDEKDRIVIMT